MRATCLLVGFVSWAASTEADVDVEYVGHASFVVTSPSGVRIAIDPFNSNRWLGYRFPQGVEADGVLVTHPHYDHDASYYFPEATPVFRRPGRYRVGDVEILGVEGRHADPYGKDFGQSNTIWLLETGGLRLAHLGDNGPLTDRNIRELGRVDVVFLPADGDDHILKQDEIVAIRQGLSDPLVVPMHYRLKGFVGLPRSLGLLEPWLANQEGVVSLDSNRATLRPERDPAQRVLVLEPSPVLQPWAEGLQEAWKMLDRARDLSAEPSQAAQAAELVKRAFESGEGVVFAYQWARALTMAARPGEAKRVLEEALASAAGDDWEYRMRAHGLLAQLYQGEGRLAEAEAHQRIVLLGSYRQELLDEARRFLGRDQ